MRFIWTPVGAAVAASIGLSGCMGNGSDFNVRPSTVGTVSSAEYDGVSNDLLTAGLGKSGLQSAVPPAYANPLQPTAAELRRAARHADHPLNAGLWIEALVAQAQAAMAASLR